MTDIAVFSMPFYGNFLAKTSSKNFSGPLRIEEEKIFNHAYKVKFTKVRDNFFFNFLETFHPGWKLYSGLREYKWNSTLLKKPLEFSHYQVNNFSNAWWVDVKTLCRERDLFCIK